MGGGVMTLPHGFPRGQALWSHMAVTWPDSQESHSCDLITYFLVPSPQTLPYLSSSTVIQEKFPPSNVN